MTKREAKATADEDTRKVARRLSGDKEICAECGDSVRPGSGKFANRVPIFDDYRERAALGYPHPEGSYICSECDSERQEGKEVF